GFTQRSALLVMMTSSTIRPRLAQSRHRLFVRRSRFSGARRDALTRYQFADQLGFSWRQPRTSNSRAWPIEGRVLSRIDVIGVEFPHVRQQRLGQTATLNFVVG